MMQYFGYHLGDYARDAGHLSWDEDMAYVRLLRLYYSSETPPPGDVPTVCRLLRATESYQQAAIESVLREFFYVGDDGCWHQKRCDAEIASYKGKSDKAKHAAALRWQSKRIAKAKRTQSDRYANQEPRTKKNNAREPTVDNPGDNAPEPYVNVKGLAIDREGQGQNPAPIPSTAGTWERIGNDLGVIAFPGESREAWIVRIQRALAERKRA